MIKKKRVTIEVTSTGVYASVKNSSRDSITIFSSLEECLAKIPKFCQVKASISRDAFFLRKLKLPSEALKHLKENPSYIAQEIFPDTPLEIFTYIIPEESEVLFLGIPKEIFNTLKKDKRIIFITVSSFLYVSNTKESTKFAKFLRVLRKISQKFYELCVYKEGHLYDSFLITPEEARKEKSNVDFIIEDTFQIVNLLHSIKEENLEFFLFKKDSPSRTKHILITTNIILAVFTSLQIFSFLDTKENLKEVNTLLETLQEKVNEYYKYMNENKELENKIEKLKKYRSNSLFYLWKISSLLPSNTVLKSFVYEHGKFLIIEGEAISASQVLNTIVKSRLFKEVRVESIYKSGEKEYFRLKLLIVN